MTASTQVLNPAEAARRLGVSAKALRHYEQRGLVTPMRSMAGWRAYGPAEMARATEIVALRRLGLSLVQVARVLGGNAQCLEPALAAHQAELEVRIRQLADSMARVRDLRADLEKGDGPDAAGLAALLQMEPGPGVAFDLPWPWGGERFELRGLPALTYIVGPLGSGKTRLAWRLAKTLPGAVFFGLDRLADDGAVVQSRLAADPALRTRVDQALDWLIDDGAVVSDALLVLLAGLEGEGSGALVVDMLEQGLDQPTQQALIAHLRHRRPRARTLVVLTRSSAILDLAAVGANEAVIFCPANHSPPIRVAPYPGSLGYEAVVTCLASPEVRARTEGVIAWRPAIA